jgi:hypothetical protein
MMPFLDLEQWNKSEYDDKPYETLKAKLKAVEDGIKDGSINMKFGAGYCQAFMDCMEFMRDRLKERD